ncbi:hypothetical protein EXIGLDRAFT_593380, partial [Exidia glandulosa HHB12029]
SDVKKLEANGSNWLVFHLRFVKAVKAKSKWGHFDGSKARPVAADTNAPTVGEVAAMAKWDEDEAVASQMLASRLPDSVLIKLERLGTVAAQWAALVSDFTYRSAVTSANL